MVGLCVCGGGGGGWKLTAEVLFGKESCMPCRNVALMIQNAVIIIIIIGNLQWLLETQNTLQHN